MRANRLFHGLEGRAALLRRLDIKAVRQHSPTEKGFTGARREESRMETFCERIQKSDRAVVPRRLDS